MGSWKGQSRGRVIGYRIFGWSLKYLGLDFAYFLLRLVSAYFVFASRRTFKFTFSFYHERLGFNRFKAMVSIFRNYYLFGQAIIDKTVILGGFKHDLQYKIEGLEYLSQMENGGIMISGHLGNYEAGGQVLECLGKKVNILVFDAEKQAIKNYMADLQNRRSVNVIAIRDDFSHFIEIRKAIEKKEIIAFHGDRYIDGNKTVTVPFLGAPAQFPIGPWQIAAHFKIPVSYVFSVKEARKKYRFFATPIRQVTGGTNRKSRDEELVSLVKEYVSELEKTVREYPLQWYNYYDFWKKG